MSLIKEQTVGDKHIDTSSYNAMARAARASGNLFFDPQVFDTTNDPTGTFVTLQDSPAFSLGNLHFWWEWHEKGTSINLNEGYVFYIEDVEYHIDATEDDEPLVLDGNPCFVLIQYQRGGAPFGTFEIMSELPVSQTPYVRLALYKFEAEGGIYGEPEIFHMGGDFHFDIVGRSHS